MFVCMTNPTTRSLKKSIHEKKIFVVARSHKSIPKAGHNITHWSATPSVIFLSEKASFSCRVSISIEYASRPSGEFRIQAKTARRKVGFVCKHSLTTAYPVCTNPKDSCRPILAGCGYHFLKKLTPRLQVIMKYESERLGACRGSRRRSHIFPEDRRIEFSGAEEESSCMICTNEP